MVLFLIAIVRIEGNELAEEVSMMDTKNMRALESSKNPLSSLMEVWRSTTGSTAALRNPNF